MRKAARRGNVLLAAGAVGLLLVVAPAPASATPAAEAGPGTMVVSPNQVLAPSKNDTLTFTYTAVGAVKRGTLKFVIPSGWTAPQTKKPTKPGFVSLTTANVGKLAINKRIISVKRLTLSDGGTATITYSDATTPTTVFFSTFATAAAAKGKKTLALASSPTVTGVSPSAPAAPTVTQVSPGPDSLTVYFTVPTSQETITGYTAVCGSPSNGGSSNTVSGPATSVTVFGLSSGTSYSCTLFATDATGNGFVAPWSGIPGPAGE